MSQPDLELVGKGIQICSDEIELLVGYRPPQPAKFTVEWVISDSVWYSGAGPNGFVNSVPPSYRLITDEARPIWQERVARHACFGPHEITHVLTWASWGQAWATEGFAEFTDRLYDSAAWKCCSAPLRLEQTCDETGYTGQRHAYSDLSDFRSTSSTPAPRPVSGSRCTGSADFPRFAVSRPSSRRGRFRGFRGAR